MWHDPSHRYAETNARGGILEPPGICDVKFRRPDLLKTMRRLDSKLQQLENELAIAEESLAEDEADSLRKQISARENALLPLYTQVGPAQYLLFLFCWLLRCFVNDMLYGHPSPSL